MNEPCCREIGPGHDGHDLRDRCLGILNDHGKRVDQLVHVMRRDLGGHPDRNAVGTIGQ